MEILDLIHSKKAKEKDIKEEIDVADHVEVPKVVRPVPRHPHLVVLEEKAKVELVLDGLTIVDEEPMVLP